MSTPSAAANGQVPPPAGSALRRRLAAGDVVVTTEIGPPRGADPDAIRSKVEPLRGWVHAVNITDNQSAFVRLPSWAGSLQALAAGMEPVMQLTCRDRNRIALQSDLLGAAAMGIPNLLLMTGDHPKFGDHPDAKPVFDLDSIQLLAAARAIREEGRLMSGRPVKPRPGWLLGAVENPFAPPARFRAARLGKKVTAGAEFVQTQYVFDVAGFARWLAEVRDLGLDQRCGILAGLGPVRSLRALEHMSTKVPGVYVPDDDRPAAARGAGAPGRRRGPAYLRGHHPAGAADPRGQRHPRDGTRLRIGHPADPRAGRPRPAPAGAHPGSQTRAHHRAHPERPCTLTFAPWPSCAARAR